MVPLGEWTPDQPEYRTPGLIIAKNTVPREDGTYGPLPSLSAFTSALPAACRGMGAGRTLDGNHLTFAGTTSGIYRLLSTGLWQDVSKVGGYAIGDEQRHRFMSFGSLLIDVMGINERVQVFDLESSSLFADLATTAPKAEHGAVVDAFLMLGQTYDDTDEFVPNRVWWSPVGAPNSVWPQPGTAAAATVQSGRVDLRDGGWIQGIVPGIGGASALIFGETRIWRASYIGPPAIFQFDAVERARGCYAPGSIVSAGKVAWYLSEDGWYATDGVQSVPVGAAKVDRWFLDDLDDSKRHNMWTVLLPDAKTWLCAYPGQGNINGKPNHCLLYNWAAQRFSFAELNVEALGNLRSVGYTLEGLDALGYTLDTLPISLDSRVWVGGGPIVGIANTEHKLAQPSGPNMQADFVTTDFIAADGERIFISGVQPFTDGSGVQVALGFKHNEFDAATVTSFRRPGADRFAPFRHPARRAQILLRHQANDDWTYEQGYKLRSRKEGRR